MKSYFVNLRKIIELGVRYKQILNYILGPILFLLLSYNIYNQIKAQPNLQEAWESLLVQFHKKQISICLFILLFWILNWCIEILKWQFLVKKIEPSSFYKSAKAVLVGQSFAFNSVNNMGEAFGRAICLKSENRMVGAFASVIGTSGLILITFCLGWLGSICLSIMYPTNTIISFGLPKIYYWLFMAATLVGFYFGFKWYYNFNKMPEWLKKITLKFSNEASINMAAPYTKKDLTFLLVFSLVRFVVYSIQFIITLKLFAININLLPSISITFALFASLLALPSIAFTELAIRGQLSLYFFSLVTPNAIGIVFGSVIFWIINKVVPAMFGTILALSLKIYKTK